MSTFVLVHGAWYGGWAWATVAQQLRDAGHDVHTPTLSGVGGHPDPATVDLHTHADDIVRLLDEHDLRDVVLAAHSYGGLVAREAADRRTDRIKELVMIDAWAGRDGDSLDSLAPEYFRAWVDSATSDGLIATPSASAVGVTDPDQVAWLEPRLRPQPRLTFSQPTQLSGAVDRIPTRAVVCVPGRMPFAEIAKSFGWPATEITSGHDALTVAPDRLSELLQHAG